MECTAPSTRSQPSSRSNPARPATSSGFVTSSSSTGTSVGSVPVIGSRSEERAAQVRDELVGQWPGRSLVIGAADNAGAAACDIVVVATPWDGVHETVAGLASALEGKVVISMANALMKMGREFTALMPTRGSIAANVQAAAPGSFVAAAMHHLPAKELGGIDHPIQ